MWIEQWDTSRYCNFLGNYQISITQSCECCMIRLARPVGHDRSRRLLESDLWLPIFFSATRLIKSYIRRKCSLQKQGTSQHRLSLAGRAFHYIGTKTMYSSFCECCLIIYGLSLTTESFAALVNNWLFATWLYEMPSLAVSSRILPCSPNALRTYVLRLQWLLCETLFIRSGLSSKTQTRSPYTFLRVKISVF